MSDAASAGVGEEERLARVALNRLAEPGEHRMTALVHELGACTVHRALLEEHDLHGVLTDVAARLAGVDPARELEEAERRGIRFVVPGDEEWPAPLDDLAAAAPLHDRGGVPVGLWVRGPARLTDLVGSVAIVGSRSATAYGDRLAGDLAAELALAERPVVSGAAFGIDAAAHRGALAGGGLTAAVLACSVERAYPQQHRPLLEHLAAEGLVVSEAPLDSAAHRIRFLARNRLVVALSRATVVVEAAIRSGALNSANWATRLHRVLLATPGPVGSAASGGVHQLLRSGAASLVTSGAEVLEAVGPLGQHLAEPARAPDGPRDRLSLRQQQVLDAVPVARGAGPDSIARVAGLGLREVRGSLERLAAAGLVEHDDGWRLTAAAHQDPPRRSLQSEGEPGC